jgi:hypothetical protein
MSFSSGICYGRPSSRLGRAAVANATVWYFPRSIPLAFLFALCMFFPAYAASHSFGGLYVRLDVSQTANSRDFQNALSKSYIDGAALIVPWRVIEPSAGNYDFSLLDHWVKVAVGLDKKLSLGIMAGTYTPPWVYQGANAATYVTVPIARGPANRQSCTTVVLPVPWDSNYIARFKQTIRSTADHLRSLAISGKPPGSAMQAIRIVRLTGINVVSAELMMPTGIGRDQKCTDGSPAQPWLRAGMSEDKVVSAWSEMSGAIAKSFPDAKLSLSVIRDRAFPVIGDPKAAKARVGTGADSLTARIIDSGLAQFPGNFAVQWNALSAQQLNPAVIAAGRKGAIIGWQLNEAGGVRGGAFCFYGPRGPAMRRMKCNSQKDFQAMLDNGINNGGKYIEVWAPNVDEYASSFRAAHDKLQ